MASVTVAAASVKRLARLRRSARFRRSEGAAVLEDWKAVRDAASAGARVRSVLVDPAELARRYAVGPAEVAALCGGEGGVRLLVDSAGGAALRAVAPDAAAAVAEVEMPPNAAAAGAGAGAAGWGEWRRLLVLDGVQDPGNVGSLLRTAHALGWDGALLVGGTADAFNEKTLRAGRGAQFRMPLGWVSGGDGGAASGADALRCALSARPGAISVLACTGVDGGGDAADQPLALVLGNEGHGAGDELASLCGRRVAVRMVAGADSLNVGAAGAILMERLRR